MTIDGTLVVAGLLGGFLVGLTGTGGGALMTPLLTLLFGVPPLTAVSTDLVTSTVIKPLAVGVHARHSTIRWRLVGWLCAGSVPAAFLGAVIDGAVQSAGAADQVLRVLMGATLLVAVAATLVRTVLDRRLGARSSAEDVAVSPARLVLLGAVVGLVVGITSVGSGSLVLVSLMLTYPGLLARDLVGTDLAQAVPLVLSAALGHLLFGAVDFGLAGTLLLGSLPGALLGALLSSRAPNGLIRPVLALVLLASGLSLLEVNTTVTVTVVAIGGLLALATIPVARRRASPPTPQPAASSPGGHRDR